MFKQKPEISKVVMATRFKKNRRRRDFKSCNRQRYWKYAQEGREWIKAGLA